MYRVGPTVIHSFNKYSLSTYYVPGLTLGAWDRAVNKTHTFKNLDLSLSHPNWKICVKSTSFRDIYEKLSHWLRIFLLVKEYPCSVFSLLLQLHTFWVESDNYFTVTKPWFASRMPFPLSLILPGRMSKGALNRILLTRGEPPLYHLRDVEAQVWLGLPSEQGPSRGGQEKEQGWTYL